MIPGDHNLRNFPLLWRFTDDGRHAQLSQAEFARSRPLAEEDSKRLWRQFVYPRSGPNACHLVQLLVDGRIPWPAEPSFESTKDPWHEADDVVPYLRYAIPAADTDELLFFWDAHMSVRTDWRLLLDHWDDFCYPSDDSNIAILPSHPRAIAFRGDRSYLFDRLPDRPVFPIIDRDPPTGQI